VSLALPATVETIHDCVRDVAIVTRSVASIGSFSVMSTTPTATFAGAPVAGPRDQHGSGGRVDPPRGDDPSLDRECHW